MKYIIANWKMNLAGEDINAWVKAYREYSHGKVFKSKIILAPSSPYLEKVHFLGMEVSAQNVSVFDKGAHTGEVGAFQLKEFCQYCIVGHSERKEPMDVVLHKAHICLDAGITPVICFTNPHEVSKYYIKKAILAWEDPQDISKDGVYRQKDPQDILKAVNELRSILPEPATLLYGGSVNRQNAPILVKIHGLDGVLVGNASLDPQHFLAIVSAFDAN